MYLVMHLCSHSELLEGRGMNPVHLTLNDRLAIVTFDNPPINLVDAQVLDGLERAIMEIERSNVRAVLFQAEGHHFGCGVNVHTTFVDTDAASARSMLSGAMATLHRLEALPMPTLCAVQGYCFAAALEIALRCDMIVACESAQFAQVEEAIGAATYLGGAYLLAERCGPARAREICYTGHFYSAHDFEKWNIINQVVPDETLHSSSHELASRLAAGPTRAHAVTKKLIRRFLDGGTRAADAILIDTSAPLFDSEDFRHGVDAIVTHGSRQFRANTKFEGR